MWIPSKSQEPVTAKTDPPKLVRPGTYFSINIYAPPGTYFSINIYGPPGTYFADKYGPLCDVYGTYFLINMDPSAMSMELIFLINMDPPELIVLLNMGTDKFGKHIAGGGAFI